MPGKLILVRHGQSTWNVENLFTGWHDVDLTDLGRQEAALAGRELLSEKLEPQIAFTSVLKRAIRTLWLMLDTIDRMWIPVERSWRLNERHYGALQGLNKAQTVEKHGEAQVKIWRRSYDIAAARLALDDPRHPRFDPRYADVDPELLPAAESLKDTLARVLPFWETRIVPRARRRQGRARGRARQFSARPGQNAGPDVRERHRRIQHPDRHSDALRARRADAAAQPAILGGSGRDRRRAGSGAPANREKVSAIKYPARWSP